MRLLLIEDHASLAEYSAIALRSKGFAVDIVGLADDASAALKTSSYDAIVLDLGLPDRDGSEWLMEMRRNRDMRPVIVLTARDKTEEVIKILNLGADDYLRKPFDIDELVARIHALLRRPGAALNAVMSEGNVVLDAGNRQVRINGLAVELGRREFGALELLMRRAGRVVPKAAMEEALYDITEELGSNAIEVLIHRLRKRMGDAGADVAVHTLRGLGYMLPKGSN